MKINNVLDNQRSEVTGLTTETKDRTSWINTEKNDFPYRETPKKKNYLNFLIINHANNNRLERSIWNAERKTPRWNSVLSKNILQNSRRNKTFFRKTKVHKIFYFFILNNNDLIDKSLLKIIVETTFWVIIVCR